MSVSVVVLERLQKLEQIHIMSVSVVGLERLQKFELMHNVSRCYRLGKVSEV